MSNLRVQTNQLCSIPKSPIYILQKTWEATPGWGFVSMSMAQNLSNCGSQWKNSSGFFSAPAAEHRVKIAAAVTRFRLLGTSHPWLIFNTFGVQNWFSHDFFWFDDQTALCFVQGSLSDRLCGGSPASLSQLQTATARCDATSGQIFSGERMRFSVMVGMHSVRSL